MNIDLSGSNILVTGSSRGIGRAIATALAAAGARVALHYNDNRGSAESLAGELGRGAQAFQADLADPEQCATLWESAAGAFGSLEVLINNAGIALASSLADADDAWLEVWQRTQDVNLRAPALLSRKAVRHFQTRGGGRIINIASRAAFRGDTAEYLAYAASKGGLVALSRSIARGFGKEGIKSFVVAPGFVKTDMAQSFIDRYGQGIVTDDLALSDATQAKDVAPMVVLLASGLADHATGSTIDINAGSYVH